MQPLAQQKLTFDEWLEAERASMDRKTEYFGGEVFAMAGASESHNLVSGNVYALLNASFRGRDCYAYTSDMKVWIDDVDLGAYPDVMALCGERRFKDQRRDVLTNPNLIVEVLSDGTEAYDRGDKFSHYRRLPSLTHYLLLSQHGIKAELFQRQADGGWLLSDFDQPEQRIVIPCLEVELPLADIYDKVEFVPVSERDAAGLAVRDMRALER